MNTIYLLLSSCLLLIIHWTDAASLRSFSQSSFKWSLDHRRHPSFVVDNELTTSESVLSRRRPELIPFERQRRWSKDDEVEIPIDDQSEIKHSLLRQDIIEINQTDELTTISINEQILEDNNTRIEETSNISVTTSNEGIDVNSTESKTSDESIPDNLTTIKNINDVIETSTNKPTQQDTAIILIDYTTISPVIFDDSQTSTNSNIEVNSEEYPTTITDEVINTTIILDTTQNDATIIPEGIDNTTTTISNTTGNDTKVTDQSIDYSTVTLDTIQNNTEVTDQSIDYSTIIPDTIQNNTEVTNQTIDNTTFLIDQEINNSTVISEDVQNNSTEITEQKIDDTTIVSETIQNEISNAFYEDEEYSNETISLLSSTTSKPICDQSCQCFRKCPYGYEIVNDTCQCDPPCKNYQCFGNDTCIVSKTGKPQCHATENGVKHDRPFRCYQPRDAGYHDDDIGYYNRWYYNADQDTCHLFVYRGLGGNDNNFQTLNECRLECIICAPAPNPGTCLGYIPMWYYDHKKNQCSKFEYTGCKGNENKFLQKQDCIDTCITRILNI